MSKAFTARRMEDLRPRVEQVVDELLARLITRFPDLRLAVEPADVRWKSSNLMRGIAVLPVATTGRQPLARTSARLNPTGRSSCS